MSGCDVQILDATTGSPYEECLYSCLAPLPFRKYQRRREYLESAVPNGFHKKILSSKGEVVGQIEYAAASCSGYPIIGENIIVMNCIWVLRKAKGHGFGKLLMDAMVQDEGEAVGFAALGLEGHWSPWLKRDQLEKLGFRVIDSVKVSHLTKHVGEPFTVHLMWLPRRKDAEPPKWDIEKRLEGVYFCWAHPLYHPQTHKPREILKISEF